MPLNVNEDISSCNDEPEAEAHCNQNASNQNTEPEQASSQEPKLETEAIPSVTSPHYSDSSSAGCTVNLSIPLARSHTPDIEGAHCLPTREVDEFAEIMAFSDAEEDQPNKKQNSQKRNKVTTNNGQINHDENQATAASPLSNSPPPSNEPVLMQQEAMTSASPNPTSNANENSSQEINPESGEDLDSEKVMEKLQQIQGYINQTTTAMKALEKDGNLDSPSPLLLQYEDLQNILFAQESQCVEMLSKLLDTNQAATNQEQGSSQRVGVVGSMNEVVNPLSMHERLARHETEQGILSNRLRESVAKRQDLVARYKNTRERLNTLKKQRQGLLQEERSLLQNHGSQEDPYDDSIPEADSWTVDRLHQAVIDFQGLKNKVIHLHSLYETQARNIDVDDEEAVANIQLKKEKIDLKGAQLDAILAQLEELLLKKGGQLPTPQNTEADDQPEEAGGEELTAAVAVGEALSASTDDVLASSDTAAKREHLNKLKAQLNNMKKLLDETQSIRLANIADLERRKQGLISEEKPDLLQSAEPSTDTLSFKGQIIHLTEEQRENPIILAKSQQLREAKLRLAKMEEVMDMIAMAREQGKPLTEVLTPEYMTILEDAQNELEGPGVENDNSRNIRVEEPVSRQQPQFTTRQPSASLNSDVESDHEPVAMDLEAIRNPVIATPPAIDRIPETTRKEADKKQNRNIWNAGNSATSNGVAFETNSDDPGVTELRNLQLELCQKKSTLEAIMTRMGKSSTFFADNSDNMSVNVSDGNSESEEIPRSCGGLPPAPKFRSGGHPFAEAQGSEVRPGDAFSFKENHTTQKNRNKLGTAHRGGRPASGIPLPPSATINNFNASQGVRPKIHPYEANRRAPSVTWETPVNTHTAPDNSQEDVQKMMSSALTQLSGLQQTVNHLYDSIRQSQPRTLEEGMAFSALPSSFPPLPMYPGFMPPGNLQGVCGPPYGYNYDPRNNESNSQGQIMGTLQQCLSQLHLHTMEIQALSKQLQVVGQRENTMENYPKNKDYHMETNAFQIRRPFANFHFNEPDASVMRDEARGRTTEPTDSYPPDVRGMPFSHANNLDNLDFGNQNFYQPFDGYVSTNGASHVDGRIDRPRAMQDPTPAYIPIQPLQSQASTNILNNKVLPGTRANNYWDNFRSYSHQNPLSSTRKSNSRGDTFSGLIQPDQPNNSRTKEPLQVYPNRLHENRRQNVTSRRNDHVNRASQKNSSFGMKRGPSTENFSPSVIVPEPPCPTGRRAKNENRTEDRFFQATAPDVGFVPNFPYSNLGVRSFDAYRSSRGFMREENPQQDFRNEVMKQAEDLLQKQHPQFLLKLFSYLSKITDSTDQHVALELLKELSVQDASFHNQWISSFSSLNNDDFQNAAVQNREQVNKNEAPALDKAERNLFSSAVGDMDISEAFNSAGEDVHTKEPYDVYKNLAARGVDQPMERSPIVAKSLSPTACSSISSFYTPLEHCSNSLWKRSKDHVNFFDTNRRVKDGSPERSIIGSLDQMHSQVEANNLSVETSPNPSRNQNAVKSLTPAAVKTQNAVSVGSNASLQLKDPVEQRPQTANNRRRSTNEYTFDSIIAAVFRKIMLYFGSMTESNEPGDGFLDGLHLAILRVIEGHSRKSYSPDFFASIENRLRRTLHSFEGKRICEIHQELPAAVSQVLIHQYCSYIYRENSSNSSDAAYVTPEYCVENSQSNLGRQQPRDSHYMDATEGEITDKRFLNSSDDSRKQQPKCGHSRPEAARGQRRLANSKSNRVSNQKRFDLMQMGLIDSPEGDEPEGSFFLHPNEATKGLWNNPVLAGRNTASNLAAGIGSLPVHDLAEADQSRDKPVSEIDDTNEAVGFAGLPFDLADGFSGLTRHENVPEQGLDEVPTKLRSPLQMPVFGLDDDDDFSEAFEELSYRRSNASPNNAMLPCSKFSIENQSEKSP